MKLLSSLQKSILASAILLGSGLVLPVTGQAVAQAAVAAAGLPDFTDMVERAGPAVVNIRTTARTSTAVRGRMAPGGDDDEMQEFLRRFFGVPVPGQRQQPERSPRNGRQPAPQTEEEVPRGIGSGFLISADGTILTNAHVVDGADEVYVTLTDKREFKAKIIGADARTDVAVVKIEGVNLPRLPLGDSNKIRAGEWVIAIGSPFGLENSVSAGIISAKARDTGDYMPLIQTDVAVNPGNSGGPLINMRGEVVGINSQIYSRSGGYMGISFAVPIDEAIRVSEQLKASGKVTRGRIGVQIGEVAKEVAESLGLARAQGALVTRVEAGGPAEKAGLQEGDIIMKFNAITIDKATELPRLVGATKPGTKATLSVWRKGTARELMVNIAEMEADKTSKKEEKKSKAEQNANSLGLTLSDLSDAQRKELKIDSGVMVDATEGAAARAGLRTGDIILRLNNADFKDVKQFNALVARLDPKKVASVLVRRGEVSQFIVIRPTAQ